MTCAMRNGIAQVVALHGLYTKNGKLQGDREVAACSAAILRIAGTLLWFAN